MQLEVGQIIKDVFRVCEIKHGGMGDVYVCDILTGGGYATGPLDAAALESPRAAPTSSGTKIVLKSVRTDFYQSEHNLEQFEREALIWTTLAPHPYIVASRSVDRLGQAPVIMLDYIAGGNLRERVGGGRLPVLETLRVCRQVCSAMEYLAASGILHRDLKPENILFDEDDNVRLTDFGLSSLTEHAIRAATSDGEPEPERFVGGTLPYMSPEHFGDGEISSASDVYSAGAVIFELLEGRPPFERDSVAGYRNAHRRDDPPALDRSLPKELRALVERCLRKNPRRRFASFAELDRALADVAARNHLDVPAPQTLTRAELESELTAATWNQRGYAFGMLGRDEDSLRSYRRALELNPSAVGVYANVGSALGRLGREEEALDYREREVAAHPEVPISHAILGESYAARGRYDEAAKQLELATAGDPANLRFMRMLAGVYRRLDRDGDFDAQVARIHAAMAGDPDTYRGPGWVNEGLHFGLMDEFPASLELFDEGVTRFPKFLDGWYNRAVTLFCLGRGDDALQSLGRAQELNPGAPQVLFLAGLVLLARRATAEAADVWETLADSQPSHRYGQFASTLGPLARLMPADDLLELVTGMMNIPDDLYYRV